MDPKRKRIGSALCAALLTVSLNGRVWADGEEPEPMPQPPMEIIGDGPLDTQDEPLDPQDGPLGLQDGPLDPQDGAVLPAADPAAPPVDLMLAAAPGTAVPAAAPLAAPAAVSPPAAAPAAEGDPAGRKNDPPASGEDPEQTETLLVVGDEAIDLTAAASGDGWSYDAEGGFVYLKGFLGPDQLIGTAGSDLTLKNSGLNHVGTLIVDGDLNLIGSGILLVDSIEMPEGKQLNLLTNTAIYDSPCSVAVFLKTVQEGVDEDGLPTQTVVYKLINGSLLESVPEAEKGIAGVLDEDCTVPEGVTLWMPEGSALVMQSVTRSIRFEYQEEVTSYSTEPNQTFTQLDWWRSTAPQLLISETAKLIVDQLATITGHAVTVEEERSGLYEGDRTIVYRPSICVEGDLTLNGKLDGLVLELDSEASFEGGGQIENAAVAVHGGRSETIPALDLTDSVIALKGRDANVEELKLAGSNTLVYSGDNTLSSVEMASGSTLDIQAAESYGLESVLTVDGTVTGGSGTEITLKSGILSLESSCSIDVPITNRWQFGEHIASFYHITTDPDGNVIANAAVYDYKGLLEPASSPRIVRSPQKPSPAAPIPAELTMYYDRKPENFGQGGYLSFFNASEALSPFVVESAQMLLDYNTVLGYYQEKGELTGGQYSSYCFLLETEENGRFGYTVLGRNTAQGVPAGTVTRIRVIRRSPDPMQGGGGTATDTVTVFSGNGSLGLSAGSMTGGGGTSVLSGGGLAHPVQRPQSGTPVDPVDPVDPGGSEDAGEADETEEESDAGENAAPVLWVESEGDSLYRLCAAEGEATLRRLGGSAGVSMRCALSDEDARKPLYAVFRNPDGSLTAFRASWDARSGLLSFRADRIGRFVIVAFAFDGEEFSDAFYRALAALPAVARLV